MMKIKQTLKKNQKPIERDASFRYICPNIDCRFDHWLSLKQVQTKNFKVVCDCGSVFKPKTILKIKIIYQKDKESQKKQIPQQESTGTKQSDKFNTIAISLLVKYGFSELESETLVNKAISKCQDSNVASFVKYILANLKELEN